MGNDLGSTSSDERMWAMLCHLSTFSGYLIPFGNILGPLIIWLVKKEQYSLVDDQGKEALNFQISVTIYVFVCGLLVLAVIGIALLPALIIFDLIVTIIATMKANSGERYRYPLCIRFIK